MNSVRNITIIFAAAIAGSCVEPNDQATEPDAGVEQKVACPQCELYCENVCYKKRYDNTLACTNEAYYSHCLFRCGVDIDALPQLCTDEYLYLQSCILNARSPAYVCTNGQPTLRESWRCMGYAFALANCKATAPY